MRQEIYIHESSTYAYAVAHGREIQLFGMWQTIWQSGLPTHPHEIAYGRETLRLLTLCDVLHEKVVVEKARGQAACGGEAGCQEAAGLGQAGEEIAAGGVTRQILQSIVKRTDPVIQSCG